MIKIKNMKNKIYPKLVRAINLKTGKVQWLSQFIAENTPFLEKNGYKVDDPEYTAFLNEEKNLENAEQKEQIKEEKAKRKTTKTN